MSNKWSAKASYPTAAVLAVTALWVVFPGCAQKIREPVPGEKVLSHVVKPGESLEDIADDYYGDPDRADEIRDFNRLGDDEVNEGDVLRVYMVPKDLETLGRRERARVPYNTGLELVARGSFLDATAEFREAARLDPDFAEAQYNLGVTYQKLDAHDKAIEAFARAVRLRAKNSDYHYAIGGSYFHLGRYDEAVQAFEKALLFNPANIKAQYSLAAALEKDGKLSRARKAWEKYLEMDSDSDWADRARSRLAPIWNHDRSTRRHRFSSFRRSERNYRPR